ncbi:MAG: hypothetical protein NTY95_13270 [Bacteroidia bacterium]|jgi:hypothetical protein|nr:hypothetical protein [Bacteroidia bacterium]
MKTLKTQFRMNELPYTLLKRNEVVALYGIGGTYTDEILHYEVDIIYTRKDKYGEREYIADNENFGRDRSNCFMNKDLAEEYFNTLTAELTMERILSQGVAKSIAGVQENNEVIPESHLVMTYEPCNNSGRLGAINSLQSYSQI